MFSALIPYIFNVINSYCPDYGTFNLIPMLYHTYVHILVLIKQLLQQCFPSKERDRARAPSRS